LGEEESLNLFDGKKLNDMIRKLILDCNGHPRSLSHLWQILNDFQWNTDSLNYNTILRHLLKCVKIFTPPVSIVKAALLGSKVFLDCKPCESKSKTYGDYIAEGVLINSLDGNICISNLSF